MCLPFRSQCQGIPLVDLNKALSDPKRKAEYKDALAVWEKQFNESEGRLRGFHMKLPEWVESLSPSPRTLWTPSARRLLLA